MKLIESLSQDARYGLRTLGKAPAFTAVAVLTLALGIGANTAIFSLIDAVMLRSLPVRNPQQLVLFGWQSHSWPQGEYSSFSDCANGRFGATPYGCSFPLPFFEQMETQKGAFSGIAAFAGPTGLEMSGMGASSSVNSELVSGDYFSTLGVTTIRGRPLEPSDDLPSTSPSVVLNYAFWHEKFGGDNAVVGRTLVLNHVVFTIVGVGEPSFTNLSPGKTQDAWIPIAMAPRLGIDWAHNIEGLTNWWLVVLGRLKPAVSLQQANSGATAVFRDEMLHGGQPVMKKTDDPRIVLTPAQEGLTGRRGMYTTQLYLLMFGVGMILLIACANVAGLLLVRASGRQKEIAVRLTLGAGRMRIVRQLLTESVLLSASGGLLGVLFAYWGVHVIAPMVAGRSHGHFPFVIGLDWRVLLFVLGASILSGIFFGLAPALQSLRLDLTPCLKESASTLPGGARRRRVQLANALVVAQVALSVVVLAGAGLLVRTLENLRSINPGFDPHNVLLFELNPSRAGYSDTQIVSLYRSLRGQLAAIPGMTGISYSSDTQLSGDLWTETIRVEGQPQDARESVDMLAAGQDYFRTMRIPLLAGRTFMPVDFGQALQKSTTEKAAGQNSKPSTAPVAVLVNETFARRYFGKQNPLGKGIAHVHGNSMSYDSFDTAPESRDWQIIGVVGDTKDDTLRRAIQPMIYVPFTTGGADFELRTASDPTALAATVRQIVKHVDSNLPVEDVRTETDQIDELLVQERMTAQLSSFFGILALALSSIGLYGLLSYEVSRRTREIGIRMALGAQQRDVSRLVVGHGIVLALAGTIVGLGAACGATRYIQSVLYGVKPIDARTFAAIALLLLFVALGACLIPARRAMRVDPMVALRYE